MRIRPIVVAAALLVSSCGSVEPTPSASPAPSGSAGSPSAAPSADVEALLGPWRPAPVAVADELAGSLRAACAAEAGADLLIDAAGLPLAVVDTRGQARATVVLADDSVAILCEALVEADGASVAIGVPPIRIAPEALGPVDDEAIEIVGYGTSDMASEPRTSIVGRVGRAASDVIAAFDDESEVYSSKANGWFAAWWPGAIDPSSVAAVNTQNLVIASAEIPGGGLEPGVGPASWWVDPAAPPTPDSTSIRALIRERACASGRSPEGRVLEPQVFASTDAFLVTIWVRLRPGDQDCPGNPEFPLEIELGEPLGDRHLLDGSEAPPRDATLPPD